MPAIQENARGKREADLLLKEAQKIIRANVTARTMNKDWLQRAADYFKRLQKEGKKGAAA